VVSTWVSTGGYHLHPVSSRQVPIMNERKTCTCSPALFNSPSICLQSYHHLLNMSQSSSKIPATIASSSIFKVIFEKALEAYKTKTKQDLTAHPLTNQLQASDSPAAILTILQHQVHQFEQSQSSDERLWRWIKPTVNVLYTFSATLGQGVSLVDIR
jgi:hypothetical protein